MSSDRLSMTQEVLRWPWDLQGAFSALHSATLSSRISDPVPCPTASVGNACLSGCCWLECPSALGYTVLKDDKSCRSISSGGPNLFCPSVFWFLYLDLNKNEGMLRYGFNLWSRIAFSFFAGFYFKHCMARGAQQVRFHPHGCCSFEFLFKFSLHSISAGIYKAE